MLLSTVTDNIIWRAFCASFGMCNKQDSSITVAFDDIPEEGLNSPLRLEKVANEVWDFEYFWYYGLEFLQYYALGIS